MKDLKSLNIKTLTESEQINLKGGCNHNRQPTCPPPAPPPVIPPSTGGN